MTAAMYRLVTLLVSTAALLSLPIADATADQPAAVEETRAQGGWTELDRRPGKGEQCIVCGYQIHDKEIVELRYKGRTFHVSTQLLDEFESDPERYFYKLEARSVLFDESSVRAQALWNGWLYAGLYVLLGLVFAALCGYVAVQRALAPIPWFFAGLAGNVAALVLLLVTPKGDVSALPAGIPKGLAKVPATRAPVACRACGALNHPSASACSSCHAALTRSVEPETMRV